MEPHIETVITIPVKSVDDLRRWMEHNVATALDYLGMGTHGGLQELKSVINGTTLSTAFSGTGGPEVAMDGIACCVKFCLRDVDAPRMQSLFAIENLVQSQCELRMLPTRPLCIFHDMTDCLVDGVRDVLKRRGR